MKQWCSLSPVISQLLLDKITSTVTDWTVPSFVPPTSTNHDPPWGSHNDCHAYHYWWGPSFPSGGPLIDLLTKDESVPSRGGGCPGWGWGEEPCVLLRVGIRLSRAFFTLIGTTPEPHTKSITSGAVGTQCGRARGTNRSGPGALGAFERAGPLTLPSRETREQEGEKRPGKKKQIRGRFCGFFVLRKGLVAKVQRAFLLEQGSSLSLLFSLYFRCLIMAEGWRLLCLRRTNYLLEL